MHALQMQRSLVLTLSPAVSHSRSNTRTPRRNTRWTGAVRSARETVCSLPSRRPCYRPAVSVWTRTPLRSPYPALLRPDPLYRRPVARKWLRDSRSRSTLLWWWGSPSSAITSIVWKRLTVTTILHFRSYCHAFICVLCNLQISNVSVDEPRASGVQTAASWNWPASECR